MKAIIIYVLENGFNTLKHILHENEVDGISYFDIMGQGSLERESSERIVQGYETQEKFIPEFARRTRVETIVPDNKVDKIISAIKKDENVKGKIFVFDVLESHDL